MNDRAVHSKLSLHRLDPFAWEGVGRRSLSAVENLLSSAWQRLFARPPADPPIRLAERNISLPTPLCLTSDTQAFDAVYNYVLRDGKIYFKPQNAHPFSHWKEIPFGRNAVRIAADQGTLIAIDDSARVYCANTRHIAFHLTFDSWNVDAFDLRWHKRWFHLFGVASVVNFFKPAALYAMKSARAIAISSGEQIPKTLYMLNPSGTRIFFADSRLHNKFHNEVTLPEEGQFTAETMAASGSTLFLLNRAKSPQGRELVKMFTRYVDFNSIQAGKKPSSDGAIYRDDWLKHDLTLEENAHVTRRIAIVQTGKDLTERELRIEGTDRYGRTGYYVKKLCDRTWNFKHTGQSIAPELFLSPDVPAVGFQNRPPLSCDYAGIIQIAKQNLPAVLRKFSGRGKTERGLHTALEYVTPSGQTVSVPLYAKKKLNKIWDYSSKKLQWYLGTRHPGPLAGNNHSVTVEKDRHQITVRGQGFQASFARERAYPLSTHLTPAYIRFLIRSTLPFFVSMKLVIKAGKRLFMRIAQKKDTLKAQERFFQSIHLKDAKDAQEVLSHLLVDDPSLAPKTLVDFLCRPSVAPFLPKLMKGANCVLEGDTESLFWQCTQIPGAKPRPSSHPHQKGTSYGIESTLLGECLIWKDQEGKMRLQFEAHSLTSLFKAYFHLVDYLRYKLNSEQQGLYGSSKHTDAHPLVIRI